MEGSQAPGETFTCSICGKILGSKKSQIRHISYCRKSRASVRSRKKACLICTKAKTHCDLAYPRCSRCTARNLACSYERPQLTDTPSQTFVGQHSELALTSASTLEFSSQLAGCEDVAFTYPPVTGCSTELLSSDSLDCGRWDFDAISGYVENGTAQTAIEHTRSSPQLPYFEPGTSLDFSNAGIVDTSWFNPITLKAPRAFGPRRVPEHQFSLNKNYVICSLRSYPFMILPGKSLPPFIHPQCVPGSSSDGQVMQEPLLGPLATCAAIVQMFSVKNKNNAVFIWKAVRMEQERLLLECSQFNDWETTAALQAVAVYFLLRLSEDNDEATNFDIPLINTMVKLSGRVSGFIRKYQHASDGSTSAWKDWALSESLCRTITILFLVDLLFDVFSALPPHKCADGLLLDMALPCGRDLWRAASSAEWRKEYMARDGSKQLTYGDLLNCRFRTDHMLDSWLGKLDDFGTLVMAAASLPGVNSVGQLQE